MSEVRAHYPIRFYVMITLTLVQEDTKLLVGNERYEGYVPDIVAVLASIIQFNYTIRSVMGFVSNGY